MKFSIVTISFNQAAYLEHAIRSVVSQLGVDLEYIVVDPGSTDGSRDIISRYRDLIDVAILEPDNGPADGLNRGFAAATGDVFGFINADDELLPGSLAAVADAFQRRPSLDVVSGCGQFVDEDGRAMRAIVPSRLTPWLYAHGAVTVFQQGTFFRSAQFTQVGGFRQDNRTCWDGELFLDMALAGATFATIGKDLARFRVHAGSITGSGRLAEPYRVDCDRLFEKAMGRARRPTDRLSDALARILKWSADPYYVFRRLSRLSFNG